MMVIIKRDQLRRLVREAENVYPIEACALLFGSKKDDEVKVEEVIVVPNEERSSVSFTVDSESFYRIYREMEEKGKMYVGVFHSHPAPPNPSGIDLEMMMYWPDIVWLIYSTTSKKFGAYVLRDEGLLEVKIEAE